MPFSLLMNSNTNQLNQKPEIYAKQAPFTHHSPSNIQNPTNFTSLVFFTTVLPLHLYFQVSFNSELYNFMSLLTRIPTSLMTPSTHLQCIIHNANSESGKMQIWLLLSCIKLLPIVSIPNL